jgi:hypothetical protein
MDLGTMKAKAEAGTYKSPDQVQEDFRRVFQNAKTYNPAGSDVYYMATVLQVGGGAWGREGKGGWVRCYHIQEDLPDLPTSPPLGYAITLNPEPRPCFMP